MYPLLLVSLLMWTLIAERIYTFFRLEFRDLDLAELVRRQRQGEPTAAGLGLRRRIIYFLQANLSSDRNLNRRLLDECRFKLQVGIDRHIAGIGVLAAVSPLLGLLGTVTGMITTFDVIALFGTGNARALAGGISEALITTQSGLLVAIPGIFAAALLALKARRLRQRLQESIITLKRLV
ncbi:MAG TPA: MotA/TolQ/ExbB proton channel family protein [Proteobacteria bacterium]|nr:MotA/TolQ/ExbB proton channel family protein [Pseudomonadota bacterium]